MSKTMSLAAKIKQMKKGDRFPLADKQERVTACQAIRVLRDAGAIKLDIRTGTSPDGQYFVYAIS